MQKGRTVPDLTQTEKIHCTEKNTQCLRSFWMQGNIFFKKPCWCCHSCLFVRVGCCCYLQSQSSVVGWRFHKQSWMYNNVSPVDAKKLVRFLLFFETTRVMSDWINLLKLYRTYQSKTKRKRATHARTKSNETVMRQWLSGWELLWNHPKMWNSVISRAEES